MAKKKNIYQGTSSCYAVKEGVWVPGSGVTPDLLPSFIALIMRDVVRGWSYDREGCREIPFDVDYGISRLNYLIALATKHVGEVGYQFTKEAIEKLFREYKLPEGITAVRLAGYKDKLDKIAKEIEDILGVKVIKEYFEIPQTEKVKIPA
jgi:hypothetical protein